MLDSRLSTPVFTALAGVFDFVPGGPRMLKQTAPRLAPEQYEHNFSDINPPLTRSQALEEGSRCLFCYDAPCIKACPTGIDVPQFIRQIGTGNIVGDRKSTRLNSSHEWISY